MHLLQHLLSVDFLTTATLTSVRWHFTGVLDCISLMLSNTEYLLLICLLAICISSAHFSVGFFVSFLLLVCMNYLYILEIKPLSVASFTNAFSQFVGCVFILFMVSFAMQELMSLISSHRTNRRTDAEAETPILWPSDAKSWLIGKDPDAGRDWGQEEKGMTEDEMVGWHHWLNEHEFEQTPGIGDGQGSLACWRPWGSKESDTTERLN